MKFKQGEGDLKALQDESLKNVDDFFYLGSWSDCCSKDVNVRIGKAWSALHKLDTIWKSELPGGLLLLLLLRSPAISLGFTIFG